MLLSKKTFKKTMTVFFVFMLWIAPVLASATDVIIEGPTPDTTAPELKSLEISANEATPENSVKLIAEVTDDLSGVRSVSGYYRSPNNNSKYITFYLNQTTNKYEATISFSQYADPGEWVLNYLSLYDNKDNSVTVYDTNSSYSSTQKFDYSSFVINVSGVTPKPPEPPKEDFTPPVLNDIEVINQSVVNANEYATIVADVTDDKSGVSSVSARFVKQSGRTQNVYLYYNQTSQKYEGRILVDAFEEIGTWKLQYVYMYDKEYNSKTIYDSTLYSSSNYEKRDFSSCTFDVGGTTPDLIGPMFKDLAIEVVQLSKTEALVKYTAEVKDILSGVSSVYANFSKPSGRTFNVNFSKQSDKYIGTVKIDKFDELGQWKINYFRLTDNKDNTRYIRQNAIGANDGVWDLSKYSFNVRGLITIAPVSPSSLEISPKDLTMAPGESIQLQSVLKMTDGSSSDVTSSAGTTYLSTNPEQVQVDQNGLINVSPDAEPGFVYIQAQNGVVEDSVKITIPGEISESFLSIKPFSLSLSPGQSKQLYVEVSEIGVIKEITSGSSGIKYVSDNSSINVSENGLVFASPEANPGTATITINYNGIQSKAAVKVTGPPIVKSLAMSPSEGAVPAGETIQLMVRATMSDGSTKDVTNSLEGTTYVSSNSSKAVVSENGLVTVPPSAQNGEVIITAKNNGQIIKSIIIVSSPILKELQVTPNTLTMFRGDTLSLSIKGMYSDGEIKDLKSATTGTTYISSVPSRVMVNESGDIIIPETATYGDATITIKNGIIKTTVLITVVEDPSTILTEIKTDLSSYVLHREESVQLKVTGIYGDGASQDLTFGESGTTYISSVPSRATINSDGVLTIPSSATYGNAIITVKNGSLKTTVLITVEEIPKNQLVELKLLERSSTVYRGDSKQLMIQGIYADMTEKDVTSSSEGTTYLSSVPSRAIVDENGKITIPSNAPYGTATITIKNDGLQTTYVVTVEEDISNKLTSINASAPSQSGYKGSEIQLKVTGILGNGAEKDLTLSTEGTTYISSVPSRAKVDENGKVTIPTDATYGPATITIKNDGLQTTYVITVEEDVSNKLTSIDASAASQSGYRGSEIQLKVTGTLGNGAEKDLTLSTEGTTYISSVPSRAKVDENGKITIPTDATYGPATITIKNDGLQTTYVVTVEEDVSNKLTSINASAASQSGYRGSEIQLKVTGTLGNGEEKDLTLSTEGTTYISSVPSRAVVDENGKITIPTAATYGPATITIKNNGLQTTLVVTVEEDVSNKLISINASAGSQSGYRGNEIQLKVTGTLGNGAEKDLTLSTEGTTYISSVPSRAVVDENGKITIPTDATYGPATITIKNNGLQTTYVVTVEEDVSNKLTSINASAASQSGYRGSEIQLKVTGTLGNGQEKDLTLSTEGTAYISSIPSRAKVDGNGRITIPSDASYGTVTITIMNGLLKTSFVVTVKENLNNRIVDFNVLANSQQGYQGDEVQLQVMGLLGSGEEKDITASSEGTTYLSSVPSRAVVDQNGKISIPSTATFGNVTITVKNGAVYKYFVLTVAQDLSKVMKEIKVSPITTLVSKGSNAQLLVSGIYGNGDVKNITNSSEGTTYLSSVPSRAIVDASGFITIPASASPGNVTITIKNGTLKTTVVLTVQ